MGMNIHAVGYRPPDEEWEHMKSVWLACEKAGVEIPKPVLKFFDHEEPGDSPGKEVSIKGSAQPWRDDMREGYQIDIQALPPGVRYVRVFCQW